MGLIAVFLVVPLIEIALFIQIGGAIGLGWTLSIVILTAIAGAGLLRRQGVMAWLHIRNSLRQARDPSDPIAQGAMILMGGALLLTPGFFTDAVGFALMSPTIRRLALHNIKRYITRHRRQGGGGAQGGLSATVIDGSYEEVTGDGHAKSNDQDTSKH